MRVMSLLHGGAAGRAARALLAFAALGLAARAAGATVYTRFDFETPGYGAPPRHVVDHCLLESGGLWHLFYTELPSAVARNRIGHAVSTDLVHWTEHAAALEPGAPAWMSAQVWAPDVVPLPGGGWRMFFAGVNGAGAQVIGSATSADLDTWQLDSADPAFVPPAWVRWGPNFGCDLRDPDVRAEGDHWSLVYTCMTAGLPTRPAVGRMTSSDLLTWTDAGPLVIDSTSTSGPPLESPSLLAANGRGELHYTRLQTQMIGAPTVAGPFDPARAVPVDPHGTADEWVTDGSVQLMSRVRQYGCVYGTTVIVIDTVTATPTGYAVPGFPHLPAGWTCDGDAFVNQPTFGDGPALRGGTPADPEGLRWVGTGETRQGPDSDGLCTAPAQGWRTGWALSPPFVLQGDLLAFRLMGRTAPDSTYLALLDDCTGQELARQTGPGTSALTPGSWSNTGRRGWRVRLELVDRSTVADGVIGLDAVADSSAGAPAPPTLPAIAVSAPLGGENLTPGTSYTLRWAGSSPAGLDSFVVYVSYDGFATPPLRLVRRGGGQQTWGWTVPAGPKFDVRIRVVAYARNAVHACAESPPFTIGVTAGVEPGAPAGPAVRLAVLGQPGPRPVVLWSGGDAGPWTLVLYDVRGRRVRTLAERAEGGAGRAAWDGRTDGGALAPPGLYFARLAHAGGAGAAGAAAGADAGAGAGASAVLVRTVR